MGERLLNGFQKVLETNGLKERMLVSINAGIPSAKAAELPDSEDNLKKLEAAIKEITGENVQL